MKNCISSNEYRLNWADIAKGIGIFLVVLGHTSLPVEIRKWIFSFHMPLFFVLSGYFFRSDKYCFNDYLGRKCKTLLIPYFFFLIVNWIGFNLLPDSDIPSYSILEVLVNGATDPTWFLIVLFLVEVLHYLIDKVVSLIKKESNQIFLWVCVCALCLILRYLIAHRFIINLPYALPIVPHYLAFFIIGRMHWINIQKSIHLWLLCMLLVIYIVIESPMPYGVASSPIISLFILSYVLACLGIYCTINFSYKVALLNTPIFEMAKNVIIFFGKNSIVVLGFHGLIWQIIKHINLIELPIFILLPIRILAMLIGLSGLIFCLKKWFPVLIGKH